MLTLIQNFKEPEKLDEDNSVRCPGCRNRKARTTKTMLLDSVSSQYLIIQLKRFYYTIDPEGVLPPIAGKITTPILLAPRITVGECTYNLTGIVYHSGDLEGGHYTARAKLQDGSWIYCDDNSVIFESDESGPTKDFTPYLLFYSVAT